MAKQEEKFIRPPVVVVMGHVDHGKTTLLDYIRRTNVASKESGGITQHIGAYEINYYGKRITFLDTPGHEAFSKMRSRGAHVADIAILVVAADEGVKPQTKEAISHIKEAGIPMIVAINKMDRPGADPQKVKQELANLGVLVEGWGGDVPVATISAKTGQGVDTLLDLLLLVAEMEELRADPNKSAEGVVIESQIDRKKGAVATLLVQNGSLKKGDSVLAGQTFAKIKLLENFEGKPIDQAPPSTPVRVLGWEKLPEVGERFRVGEESELRAIREEIETLKTQQVQERGDILLIVKADVSGSLEALSDSIMGLPHEGVKLAIISSGVGDISESDIKLAYAAKAIIVAFRVKISREAELLLKNYSVRIISSDVIYDLIDLIQKEILKIQEEKDRMATKAKLEVLALFSRKENRQIIGGKVIEGTLKKRMQMTIFRRGEKIGRLKIINLQKDRRDVEEVETGFECGLLVESIIPIAKGDILEEIKE